jgi:LCP family protein required for cell wall assembly
VTTPPEPPDSADLVPFGDDSADSSPDAAGAVGADAVGANAGVGVDEEPVTTTYRKPRRSRTRRILKWTSISLVVILVIAAGGVFADGYYLNHKIKTHPFVIPSGETPPPVVKTATKAENFLLIGSDSRAGSNGKGTGGSAKFAGASRSDTTIIMHISANNAGATLISIPRDSYVQIPSCVIGPNNQLSQPEKSKFNAAFSLGGQLDPKYAASCTEHAIETLTNINITHYAVVDFTGFQKMVDALGGVKMCVAKPLVDPVIRTSTGYDGSGLDLQAGKNVEIDGDQALDLMRARYALDGGGDLPRIKRQQEFIGAMIRKATSTSLLTDPLKLQRFLSAAAGSLTTDGFGLHTMEKLATALHSAGAGKVRLLTVPNIVGAPDVPSADVEWDPVKAPELWQAIRDDTPIPGTKVKASAKPTVSPTPTPTVSAPTLIVAPSGITVNVENGTATQGMGQTVATALEAQGFHIGTITDAPKDTYAKTIVEYGSDKVQSSQTLQEAIPGSVRKADAAATTALTIIVGASYTDVVPVTLGVPTSSPTPTPVATESISTLSAAKNACLS